MSVNSHSSARTDARKHPVQQRSRRTVDTILEAAAHLFTTVGYSTTTTNTVAEVAGVSIGSLYQYFPNKDSLLAALEERHLDEAEAALRSAFVQWQRDEPSIEQWAAAFVNTLVAVNDTELHRVMYNTTPHIQRIAMRVEGLVREIADDLTTHLCRWNQPDEARLRARIIVVATLAVVHEIVIQLPKGPRRTAAVGQVTESTIRLAGHAT